ncbi:MAG: hypothetical protein NWF00_00690 [Candidatus Bathyarchaeota archaeon]|nr:hypothetical protein [Candidatus Bathyarchaeota archaeon]
MRRKVLVALGVVVVLSFSTMITGDFVQVKAADETVQWIKDIGPISLGSVIQTVDGGFAIAGGKDGGFLLLKTDESGDVQWEKTYGTDAEFQSFADAIVQADDGGYVLAGQGTPWPNFIGPNGTLFNLLKTDASGEVQWSRNFSTKETPFIARSLLKTSDGGYAVAGYAETGHGIMSSGTGYVCLIKTDNEGNMQWKKLFEADAIWAQMHISAVETQDGGYALLSVADFTTKAVPTVENVDFWLIKTDSDGNIQWNKTYGGTLNDRPSAFIETADGGFLLGGSTMLNYSSDSVTYFHDDAWLSKIDSQGNMLWNVTYGGDGEDAVNSVLQTTDGGYIALVAVDASLRSPPWGTSIIKLDASGNTEWIIDYLNMTQSCILTSIIDAGGDSYVSTGFKHSADASGPLSIVLVKFRAPSPTLVSPSPSIPEFQSWMFLSLLGAASVCILVKTKISVHKSKGVKST